MKPRSTARNGIAWLSTVTAGALYGRFLPDDILVAGAMGALLAMLLLFGWFTLNG